MMDMNVSLARLEAKMNGRTKRRLHTPSSGNVNCETSRFCSSAPASYGYMNGDPNRVSLGRLY